MSLMSLWRRAQKLCLCDGVRSVLFQASRSTIGGVQRHTKLGLTEILRNVYTTAQQRPAEITGRTELASAKQIGQNYIAKLPAGKTSPKFMSRALVRKVMGLSDVKEEVYGALDEWSAFELEFPVVATRMALEKLRREEQWHRVIQVTKWMFSKGVGKTHNAYGLLLKAYCKDGRLDEAKEVWDGLVKTLDRSMPKNLFAYMTNAYRRRDLPDKVVEVFEQMECFGIIPDKDILKRAGEAYQQLNLQEKFEQLGKKYALNSRTRRKEKRLEERKAKEALNLDKAKKKDNSDKAKRDGNADFQSDDDNEKVQKQAITDTHQEQRAFSKTVSPYHSRPSKVTHTQNSASKTESEFLKQVIDSM